MTASKAFTEKTRCFHGWQRGWHKIQLLVGMFCFSKKPVASFAFLFWCVQRLGTGCFRHFCCSEVARRPARVDVWCRQSFWPPHYTTCWLHNCIDQAQSPWSSAASCWCAIFKADPARVLAKVSPAVWFQPGHFRGLLGSRPIIGGAVQNTRGRGQKCLEPFNCQLFHVLLVLLRRF